METQLFSEKIKIARKERNLTLQEVGNLTGTSKSNIWSIESGQEPRLTMILALIELFSDDIIKGVRVK